MTLSKVGIVGTVIPKTDSGDRIESCNGNDSKDSNGSRENSHSNDRVDIIDRSESGYSTV